MKVIKSYQFISFYSRRYRKPNFIIFIGFYLLNYIENPKKIARIIHESQNLFRIYRSLRLPNESHFENDNLPKIELLSVVAGKDIMVLPLSIKSAVKNSMNLIELISIIVPDQDFRECQMSLMTLNLGIDIQIHKESEFYSATEIIRLKNRFGSRFGWVFQQFLALKHIRKSKYPGVLLLNSDTVILNPIIWLAENQKQILMASIEYHKPYYLLLNKLINSPVLPEYTFITHHMLFQPILLEGIFTHFNLESESKLLNWVIDNADPTQKSPLCIEFELYAQGNLILNPDLLVITKFANTSLSRSSENIKKIEIDLESNHNSRYNSVSVHDYIYSGR